MLLVGGVEVGCEDEEEELDYEGGVYCESGASHCESGSRFVR